MTSLMKLVRHSGVCRVTSGVVATTVLLAFTGCEDDRASNVETRKPVAITASGVEILEVVKDKAARTVEVAVATGGEEKLVVFEPLLDGPLPSGLRSSLQSADGTESVVVSYSWDDVNGTAWVRQEQGGDVLEISRVAVQDRVVEEYEFNGQPLRLEYADLSDAILSKIADKFRRGEPIDPPTPDVAEYIEQLEMFASFAAQIPPEFARSDGDAQLLGSLLGDGAFAAAIGDHEPSRVTTQGVCRAAAACAAVACRLWGIGAAVCGVCVSAVMSCVAMTMICIFANCDCCF